MTITAKVHKLPHCDLCKAQSQALAKAGIAIEFRVQRAFYDGKTLLGPWAYMCQSHFDSHGVGLGLGRGQILMPKKSAGPHQVGSDD